MTRLRLAMLLSIVCALPASVLAQSKDPPARDSTKDATEYYVIVNTQTKKCSVVDKTPQVDSPNITAATDAIYRSHAEAEAAIKSLKPCQGP